MTSTGTSFSTIFSTTTSLTTGTCTRADGTGCSGDRDEIVRRSDEVVRGRARSHLLDDLAHGLDALPFEVIRAQVSNGGSALVTLALSMAPSYVARWAGVHVPPGFMAAVVATFTSPTLDVPDRMSSPTWAE